MASQSLRTIFLYAQGRLLQHWSKLLLRRAESSALPLAPQPPGSDISAPALPYQPGEPPAHGQQRHSSGPPAHWLAMVREHAPQLLDPDNRSSEWYSVPPDNAAPPVYPPHQPPYQSRQHAALSSPQPAPPAPPADTTPDAEPAVRSEQPGRPAEQRPPTGEMPRPAEGSARAAPPAPPRAEPLATAHSEQPAPRSEQRPPTGKAPQPAEGSAHTAPPAPPRAEPPARSEPPRPDISHAAERGTGYHLPLPRARQQPYCDRRSTPSEPPASPAARETYTVSNVDSTPTARPDPVPAARSEQQQTSAAADYQQPSERSYRPAATEHQYPRHPQYPPAREAQHTAAPPDLWPTLPDQQHPAEPPLLGVGF
jgi:hypothetical protein